MVSKIEYKDNNKSYQYSSSETNETTNDCNDNNSIDNYLNKNVNRDVVWTYTKQPTFSVTSHNVINVKFDPTTAKPIDYYQLFISFDEIKLMVREPTKKLKVFWQIIVYEDVPDIKHGMPGLGAYPFHQILFVE